MKFCDTHIHSHLSIDSTASVAAMCEGAIANNIPCITFTDHLDLNPNDEGYGFYRPERVFEEVAAARHTFAGRVKVLQGVEFGEPHLYPETLSVLHKRPYDVIIGSIHWVDNDFPGSQVAISHPRSYFERYYTVMLAMIQSGGFDVLAHFDFPKRYLKVNISDFPVIDDIIAALVTSGIALEINTSSLRKGLPDPMPGTEILEKYARMGGTKITLGSDAHRPDDVGADFVTIQKRLTAFPHLEVGHFNKRHFIRTA